MTFSSLFKKVIFTDFKVVNVLAVCNMPFEIRLPEFTKNNRPHARYGRILKSNSACIPLKLFFLSSDLLFCFLVMNQNFILLCATE